MKKILLAFVIFLISSLLFSCDKDNDSDEWIYNESKKTWSRFNNWRGNDNVLVFPLITDLHSGKNCKYKHKYKVNIYPNSVF